jgi:hypothetical protein
MKRIWSFLLLIAAVLAFGLWLSVWVTSCGRMTATSTPSPTVAPMPTQIQEPGAALIKFAYKIGNWQFETEKGFIFAKNLSEAFKQCNQSHETGCYVWKPRVVYPKP